MYTIVKDYLKMFKRKVQKERELNSDRLFSKYYELLEDVHQRLDNETWSGYLRMFNLMTNCSIDNTFSYKITVDMLFTIRNHLIHGNDIEFTLSGRSKDNIQVTSKNLKLRRILNYYQNHKLLYLNKEKVQASILTEEAVNHFYYSMNRFAIYVYDLLPEEDKKFLTIDMFMFREAIEAFSLDDEDKKECH